jgi:ketosteroid isomerase-like protein
VATTNLDLYRGQFDAIARSDWDVVAANLDPDVIVRTDPGWPEQRIYGRQAVMTWLRGAHESLGSDFRIDEILDLGDRVLARWCWNTRGRHSGIGGELRYSEIVTFREGRATFPSTSATTSRPSTPWVLVHRDVAADRCAAARAQRDSADLESDRSDTAGGAPTSTASQRLG